MSGSDTATYESILVDRSEEVVGGDAVVTLTLNRPDKLNAWTPAMSAELAAAIGAANDDATVGAMVITGAGRGFCAGADIGGVFQNRIDSGSAEITGSVDWVGLVRSSKPIIAAIHGPAVGVGLTMVLPCDVLVATADAKIGAIFVKMGLVPELASSRFLVERVGFGAASELCLTGRMLTGAEAGAIGLVDHVVDTHAEALATAYSIAAECAANPSRQARMIKELLTLNGVEADLGLVQRREGQMLRECYVSDEHTAAVARFLERR